MTPSMLLTALRMRIGTRAMRRSAFVELVMPAAYLAGVDRGRLARDLGRSLDEWPAAGHGLTIQCGEGISGLLADHFDRADAARPAPAPAS